MFLALLTLVFGASAVLAVEEIVLTDDQIKLKREMDRLDLSVNRPDVYASCGWVLFKDYVDYYTAVQRCKDNENIGISTPGGRQLASVHSDIENNILRYMMLHAFGQDIEDTRYTGPSNWVWIGLHKENNTDVRQGTGKVVWDKDDWVWEDGTHLDELSYTNWMQKGSGYVQPDMKPGELKDGFQTAARLYRPRDGLWDDTYTSMKHPFICKFNVPVHYIVYDEPRTWDEAKETCEARGLFFAKIRSTYENIEFVKAIQRVWGTERHEKKYHHQNWIWIGATDERESGHFEFYDQEQINFRVPWARKQHDNKTRKRKGSQDHVAVSRWGEWDDSYGDHWDRPFACQCHSETITPVGYKEPTEPYVPEKKKRKPRRGGRGGKQRGKRDEGHYSNVDGQNVYWSEIDQGME